MSKAEAVDSSQPVSPSRPDFPVGGVMFVGDNLNAYGKWMQNRGHWGDPSQPTMTYWKRVLQLLKQAGIPTSKAFFTNAYVGLIEGNDPSAPFHGRKDPLRRFKGEFAQLFGPKRRGHGLNQPDEDSEGMHELHLSYLKPKAREAPNAADVRRPRKKGRRGRRR